MTTDPRLLLARDGVAAADLEGLAPARDYRPARAYTVVAGRAPLTATPGAGVERASELLFGEAFDVLLERDGFAFGRARRDGYCGWAPREALGEAPAPTHRVRALSTFLFGTPSIKVPPRESVPMNALLAVEAVEGRFARLAGGGFAPAAHLDPLGVFESRPEAVALRFLGAPYLWGGRTAAGLDCSGLVQQALHACGRGCPRDSDQQARLGTEVREGALQAGDLVFWRGHVGVMMDAERLVHANAFAMAVTLEALSEAEARIAAQDGGPITARRRPDPAPTLPA